MLFVTKNQLLRALSERGVANGFFAALPETTIARLLAGSLRRDKIAGVTHCALTPGNKADIRADIVGAAIEMAENANVGLEKGMSAKVIAALFEWQNAVRVDGVFLSIGRAITKSVPICLPRRFYARALSHGAEAAL